MLNPYADKPLVVSYGAGVDSTAMLVLLKENKAKPDAILFADVGNERPETYAYLAIMDKWLASQGWPRVEWVSYRPQRFKHRPYQTLAGNCIGNRTLPSLAFGRKSCSVKWKGDILDGWVTDTYGGVSCYRAIGYSCSPKDNVRFANAQGKKARNRGQDAFVYPLQTYGLNREACISLIAAAGLPIPVKSSCFFCPSLKKHELATLPTEQLRQIVAIEANATPKLRVIKGLWRRERITDTIRDLGLLEEAEIDAIWQFFVDEMPFSKDVSAETILATVGRGEVF